jgi:hypothetical protein
MNIASYLTHSGRNPSDLAKQVGVSTEAVRLWREGKRVPRPHHMSRLMKATDGLVTPMDFLAREATR